MLLQLQLRQDIGESSYAAASVWCFIGVARLVALGQKQDELWIAFGAGGNFRYYPQYFDCMSCFLLVKGTFHSMTLWTFLGQLTPWFCQLSMPLLGVIRHHTAFFNKGKKSAWAVQESIPELTLPHHVLSNQTLTLAAIFERFTVKLQNNIVFLMIL